MKMLQINLITLFFASLSFAQDESYEFSILKLNKKSISRTWDFLYCNEGKSFVFTNNFTLEVSNNTKIFNVKNELDIYNVKHSSIYDTLEDKYYALKEEQAPSAISKKKLYLFIWNLKEISNKPIKLSIVPKNIDWLCSYHIIQKNGFLYLCVYKNEFKGKDFFQIYQIDKLTGKLTVVFNKEYNDERLFVSKTFDNNIIIYSSKISANNLNVELSEFDFENKKIEFIEKMNTKISDKIDISDKNYYNEFFFTANPNNPSQFVIDFAKRIKKAVTSYSKLSTNHFLYSFDSYEGIVSENIIDKPVVNSTGALNVIYVNNIARIFEHGFVDFSNSDNTSNYGRLEYSFEEKLEYKMYDQSYDVVPYLYDQLNGTTKMDELKLIDDKYSHYANGYYEGGISLSASFVDGKNLRTFRLILNEKDDLLSGYLKVFIFQL